MGETTFSHFLCLQFMLLILAPKDVEEVEKIRKFIVELCKWGDLVDNLIEKAREDVKKALGKLAMKK